MQILKSKINYADLKVSDLNLAQLKLVLKSNKKNLALVLAALGVSYAAFKTLLAYLEFKKYQHIPGPKTCGYIYYSNNLNRVL